MADDREIMRDEEIGEAEALLQIDQEVDDLRLDVDVERRNRLIGDDEVRPHRQRARNRDALALPAGELMRIALGRFRAEPDDVQQLADVLLRLRLGARDLVQAQRLAEDVGHRHARVERRIGILEHHLHAAAQRPDADCVALAMSWP